MKRRSSNAWVVFVFAGCVADTERLQQVDSPGGAVPGDAGFPVDRPDAKATPDLGAVLDLGVPDLGVADLGLPDMGGGLPDLGGGVPDMGEADAGPADAGAETRFCGSGLSVLFENFSTESGAFAFDDGKWAVQAVEPPPGSTDTQSLNGRWNQGPTSGCPVTTAARLNRDLDLSSGLLPVISFEQRGEMANLDSLRFVVSIDGGQSWTFWDEPALLTDDWQRQEFVLPNLPSLRIGFEFENVCGDPRGVNWFLDNIEVCFERP